MVKNKRSEKLVCPRLQRQVKNYNPCKLFVLVLKSFQYVIILNALSKQTAMKILLVEGKEKKLRFRHIYLWLYLIDLYATTQEKYLQI